ncbi:LuxR C-terminal-related transcriptional regulator [Saccharothrix sp. Mg75]|uniref:LuxR C-terminal-related transcriptional regulator n=1 Tax=Saccharothrix sp. Mg75 TaxID=3445357 RepID=UPI003EEE01FB
MGEPVPVNAVALDPMLEAGAIAALHSCPDLVVVLPGRPAAVTVVIVDDIGEQGLDLVRAVRGADHRPEVVLVATDVAPHEALHAIAAGARGLLRRSEATAGRLARTVLAAASGDSTVPPDMLGRLVTTASTTTDRKASALSDRERSVLRLVAEGRETEEIARELSYSARTVVSVVHDITNRFRLRNRAHAVAYALRTGLL